MVRSRIFAGLLFFAGLSQSHAQYGPALGPGFALGQAGSLSTDPAEVLAGAASIKGSYFGSNSYTFFLKTLPSVIPLAPGRTYQLTFEYRILAAPDNGFEALFFSPTGGAAGSFLPSIRITGAAGIAGTAQLTSTLSSWNDYEARINVVGTGAIVIDNVQIVDTVAQAVVAFEDAEGNIPTIHLAQRFLPGARTNRTFSVALAADGGQPPYSWQLGSLPLPGGLQLGTDGYLYGRPTQTGTFVIDPVVTDASGASVRQAVTLSVIEGAAAGDAPPLSVTDGVATVVPRHYQPAFRNPLGGMRPYVSSAKTHPFASLGRQYVEWSLLENSEGDSIDKILAATNTLFGDLPGYNIKAVPRVYLIWPQLAQYWPSDLTPNDYTSPAFRSRMDRLIARLGQAWDGDPRIAYIETGIIGYWGEQHDPGFATSGVNPSLPPAIEQEFGDAFRNAFPNKLLMNRYPRNLVNYNFGTHWDVFGSFDKGFWGNDTTGMTAELQKPQLIDRWKIAPRGGEIDPTFLGEPDFSAQSLQNVVRNYSSRLIGIIQNLHWNHLAVLESIDPSDADLWDKASQIQNALGYRFVIDQVNYPAAPNPGDDFAVQMVIRNIGSSPFYYPWPLEVTLLDLQSHRPVWQSIWPGVDVRKWLPGDTVRLNNAFTLPGDLPTGQYALAVAVLDPAGMVPSVRFAVENYWTGGRAPLGPVRVGGPAPLVELNQFDDLQLDRSLYYLSPSAASQSGNSRVGGTRAER